MGFEVGFLGGPEPQEMIWLVLQRQKLARMQNLAHNGRLRVQRLKVDPHRT